MTAYSRKDVVAYYTKNYVAQPSPVTQEKLLQLAKTLAYSPGGIAPVGGSDLFDGLKDVIRLQSEVIQDIEKASPAHSARAGF